MFKVTALPSEAELKILKTVSGSVNPWSLPYNVKADLFQNLVEDICAVRGLIKVPLVYAPRNPKDYAWCSVYVGGFCPDTWSIRMRRWSIKTLLHEIYHVDTLIHRPDQYDTQIDEDEAILYSMTAFYMAWSNKRSERWILKCPVTIEEALSFDDPYIAAALVINAKIGEQDARN